MALINLSIEKPAFKREEVVVAEGEVEVETAADEEVEIETADEEVVEEPAESPDVQQSGSKLRRGAGLVTVAAIGLVGLMTLRKARRFRTNRHSDE